MLYTFTYLVHVVYTNSVQLRSSCSNFTAADESYTKPADQTFIVSRRITSTGSGYCYLPVVGYVTDSRTLNITTDSASSIYSTITDTTNITFSKSFTGNITSQDWPIRNGTSGYVGFTPIHRCITGKLSGCSDDSLDDVVIEACTPYSLTDVKDSEGFLSMHGTLSEVTTSKEEADALTCDPANTIDAKSGITSTNCSAAATSTAATSDGFRSIVSGYGLVIAIAVGLLCVEIL